MYQIYHFVITAPKIINPPRADRKLVGWLKTRILVHLRNFRRLRDDPLVAEPIGAVQAGSRNIRQLYLFAVIREKHSKRYLRNKFLFYFAARNFPSCVSVPRDALAHAKILGKRGCSFALPKRRKTKVLDYGMRENAGRRCMGSSGERDAGGSIKVRWVILGLVRVVVLY